MKKTSIKILITIWSAILIALIAVLIYFMKSYGDTGAFSIKGGNTEIQKQENISLNKCSKISVDFSSSNIIVNSSNDDKLKVVQESSHKISKLRQFVIQKNGNEILIKRNGLFIFNILNFNFNEKLEIYIPKKYAKDLSVKTSSGEVQFYGNGLAVNEAYIKSTSGDIKIRNLKCKDYNIKAVSGNINADNIEGSGNINTTSGNIDVRYSEICKYSYLKATSGNVNIKIPKKISFEFYGKSTSGDVNSNFYFDNKNDRKHEAYSKIGNGNYKSINVDITSGSINALREN